MVKGWDAAVRQLAGEARNPFHTGAPSDRIVAEF
jgi:hypothetical protein